MSLGTFKTNTKIMYIPTDWSLTQITIYDNIFPQLHTTLLFTHYGKLLALHKRFSRMCL